MSTVKSPPFDLAVTDKLLSTTRSVRLRLDLDRPVEPDVVMECLRLAAQAPTASNLQRWRCQPVEELTYCNTWDNASRGGAPVPHSSAQQRAA